MKTIQYSQQRPYYTKWLDKYGLGDGVQVNGVERISFGVQNRGGMIGRARVPDPAMTATSDDLSQTPI